MVSRSFLKKNFTKDELVEKLIKLTQENAVLVGIIEDTLWMALRYADGRSSYATEMVNKAKDAALALEINLGGVDHTLEDDWGYAVDGDFGYWNPDTSSFIKEEL